MQLSFFIVRQWRQTQRFVYPANCIFIIRFAVRAERNFVGQLVAISVKILPRFVVEGAAFTDVPVKLLTAFDTCERDKGISAGNLIESKQQN
jgi:hypothetical protein